MHSFSRKKIPNDISPINTDWCVDESRRTYNIQYWSQGYFDINDDGEVVFSSGEKQVTVAFNDIVKALLNQGASLPVLVRFPEILRHRVHTLCQAFNQAISDHEYNNRYLAVYPLKVNPQRSVVETLIQSQSLLADKQLGLEAGSKPELMAVLALARQTSAVIVCNGYKDREYIRQALIGEKSGCQVYIVLEKFTELELVLSEAKALGVTPRLGVRARLISKAKGRWYASGGEGSKFGLTTAEILSVIARLSELNQLSCLQLLHFHLGSQITSIRDASQGISECGRIYVELYRMGVFIQWIDIGGGLAVDYEGTRSQSQCSMNYSLCEYANSVVSIIGSLCRQNQVPEPGIISESGRNLTAHHAVLVTNVVSAESCQDLVSKQPPEPPSDDCAYQFHNLWISWLALSEQNCHRALVEIYHDTQRNLTEIHTGFETGIVRFEEKAWAEKISLCICHKLMKRLSVKNRAHRDLMDELSEKLADRFYLNFSLFQSLPDVWGVKQVFPVLPLSQLDKPLTRRAYMLDITCDSDGILSQYVDGQGIENTLPVPPWTQDDPYYMGVFLVGAYQEILGNMHNLFGDTDVVSVEITPEGRVQLSEFHKGNTVEDVMRYVDLKPDDFFQAYQQMVTEHIEESQRSSVLSELESALKGYTYLTGSEPHQKIDDEK
ncbi:biosynthetic arginine decarboxylase [Endozoicomonas sp.]|uniref:biosynthetic arginine decarboxylase n=1 Tax=Endozoicomonas sp. TaxID=1892382 RepID=UPI0028852517|nr:biosynthetic arginine decarboxylase [Endozoicomonas sp.]